MQKLSLIFLILLISNANVVSAGREHYAVHEKLMCGDQPAHGIQVRLYNKGTIFDTTMQDGVTDANEEFRLAGTAYALIPFENIHPWLNIFHRCARHTLKICDSEARFKLPNDNKYFKDENSVVEFGTFNLEVKLHDEETKCLHG